MLCKLQALGKSDTDESVTCPRCGDGEEGTMICCDGCDQWFHWQCVGITTEPKESEWFCEACMPS